MDTNIRDHITELNQNYNDLGEDLLMLEAVLIASEGETGFPAEYVVSSLERIRDYTCQHTKDIEQLTQSLIAPPHRTAPSFRDGRSLAIGRIRRRRRF